MPPLWGSTWKKYFEVSHRDYGVSHAKFGWDLSSSLGAKSKQKDRHLSFVHIDNISLRTKDMLSTWIKRKQKRYLWLCESKKKQKYRTSINKSLLNQANN